MIGGRLYIKHVGGWEWGRDYSDPEPDLFLKDYRVGPLFVRVCAVCLVSRIRSLEAEQARWRADYQAMLARFKALAAYAPTIEESARRGDGR